MSKSIKLKNNNYLDSKSVVHNKQLLSDIVDKLNKLNNVGLNGTGTLGVADIIIITNVIGYK